MNPLTLTILTEWLSDLVEGRRQVIITTHSLEVIRVLVSVEDRARVVNTSKESGVLRVKYYNGSDVDLEILRDKRMNIDQDWLNHYALEYYIHYKVLTLGYKFTEVPVTKRYAFRHRGVLQNKTVQGLSTYSDATHSA